MTEPTSLTPPEQPSLDPADWDACRAEAHRMLDVLIDQIRDAGDGPAWRPVPAAVKQALVEPLPQQGQGLAAVWRQCRDLVLPYGVGNRHPRFLGWVHGAGTVGGMLAEMVAAALNANAGGREQVPVYLERQVIAWFRDLFDFGADASGLLVTGSSMANLIAVAVARFRSLGPTVRERGNDGQPLVGYASAQAHNCIAKAFELCGLGRAALRLVPVDDQFRLDVAALTALIAADRAAGYRPFLVVGTAGTVNTGAIDPLPAIAALCAAEQLWFHVDGAFGAMARLSPKLAGRVAGIERADSLTFDFHKWLHVPYDAGCILVRDGASHLAAFGGRPDYLVTTARGTAGGTPWPADFGIDLSRGFRALKVWFTLKEQGSSRLGAKILDNCRQAEYLATLVTAAPDLELLAPVALNICCFRYAPAGYTGDLNRLNETIVAEIQECGIAVPSTTVLNGRLAIRINLTNHRTRHSDLDLVAGAVRRIGAALAGQAAH